MTTLRIGTRGSDLALTQSRWFTARLCEKHPSLCVEEVIIQTHGDVAVEQKFDADWPVGGFVAAIEQALMKGEIDFAVHSYKDLQTAVTPGLVIAAVPGREVVHDVLVLREPVELDALPIGFRIGTSSPRRSAQLRQLGDVEIVPIRGNVATRIAKIERENLGGVVLAAAGLKRLGIEPPHSIDLPTNRFLPSPAQGALAIQTRAGDPAESIIRAMDEAVAHRGVEAERSFLRTIGAGCHTPVGALATIEGDSISLRGQLFSDDGERMVEGTEQSRNATEVGESLARRLVAQLGGGA